jgi:hypothetical protein
VSVRNGPSLVGGAIVHSRRGAGAGGGGARDTGRNRVNVDENGW